MSTAYRKLRRNYRAQGDRLDAPFHLRTNAAWRARKRKLREMRKQTGKVAGRPGR